MNNPANDQDPNILSNLLPDDKKSEEMPSQNISSNQSNTNIMEHPDSPPIESSSKSTNKDSENLGNIPNDVVPKLTEYEVTSKCCCFEPCVRIHEGGTQYRTFWGTHELDSICMNVFVSCIIIFVELVHFLIVFPKLSLTRSNPDDDYHYDSSLFYKYQLPSLILHAITLILFLWSYFGAACMDPGFLPFNWYETRRTRYSWQEQLSGLAIRDDQYQYATTHKPNWASFSKSAGRFVIRADHICGWIGNWVGKRNHKQFILMNFWGSLYALNLFAWHIPVMKQIMGNSGQSMFFIFVILIFFEGGIEIVFAVLLFYVFVMALDDLRKDLTKIKKWKHEHGHNYSGLHAMREVCGPGNVCCFILPVPAFGDNIVFDESVEENPINGDVD